MPTTPLSTIPTTLWNLGAFQSNLNPNPIILVTDITNGAGESKYSALRIPGSAAAYQVTAGKTLYMTRVMVYSGLANLKWLTLSGTADAGQSQAAAPAGAVSVDSRADGQDNGLEFVTANTVAHYDILIKVAATLYPCARCMSASRVLQLRFLAHEE